MPPPPPRKRFQVHLSTAIILMFAVGGFIWANVVPTRATHIYTYGANGVSSKFTQLRYGWPSVVIANTYYLNRPIEKLYSEDTLGNGLYDGMQVRTEDIKPYTSYYHAALNLLIALVALFITWFLCERWIDYRAARRNRKL